MALLFIVGSTESTIATMTSSSALCSLCNASMTSSVGRKRSRISPSLSPLTRLLTLMLLINAGKAVFMLYLWATLTQDETFYLVAHRDYKVEPG
jgi:hypothetical protein